MKSEISLQTKLRDRIIDFATVSDREAIVARILNTPHMQQVDMLIKEGSWGYVAGDVFIDGHLSGDTPLIIDGNVTIRGAYYDSRNLIVLGDLTADHVLIGYTLVVTGNLTSPGLVYAYYNDDLFSVGGSLTAKVLLTNDRCASYDESKLTTELHISNFSYSSKWALMFQMFTPEVLYPALEEYADEFFSNDIENTLIFPDYLTCVKQAMEENPMFRSSEPMTNFANWITQIVEHPSKNHNHLKGLDPIIDYFIGKAKKI